jgi:thiol-disulfide isomerase/thioredoxin
MSCVWGVFLAFALSFGSQSDVRDEAHRRVRAMMESGDGRVVFSDIYNDSEIEGPVKEYLGRLYEIYFAIPDHLQSELRATGEIPSLQAVADNFGIRKEDVDLLLDIMTSEPRMPMLLARNEETKEIEILDLREIDDFIKERGSQVKVSGWIGTPVPSFELPTLDGSMVRDSELRGKKAILFVWLTRCPVCRRITPNLVELDKKYRSSGLMVLGLNADQILDLGIDDGEREEFVRERGIAFRVAMLDAKTRAALGNGNIFPMLFFVGMDGTIERLVLNYQRYEELEKMTEELLTK